MIKWLEPWDELCTSGASFERQLHTEMMKGHVLYNIPVKAIARRYDCDDVLFQLETGDYKYAVVHLTYSKSKHSSVEIPRTKLFVSIDEFEEKCMKNDHIFFD